MGDKANPRPTSIKEAALLRITDEMVRLTELQTQVLWVEAYGPRLPRIKEELDEIVADLRALIEEERARILASISIDCADNFT
jgi:tRNA(Ser,Leu) C12 N-acetylase TAN1